MRQRMTHNRSTSAARGGFTLIEMLVATTLVVMMMLMFAQIYVAAISSLGEQQAIARNDGKARLADILLRADLRRMSFQSAPGSNQGLLPLVRDDNSVNSGYFYLSENDQTNPVDDVLQFTTYISSKVRNPDQSAYYGRCKAVPGLHAIPLLPGDPDVFSNHPDADDGDTSNGVGASRAAEVSYFVRNGNLYRRVLLLRDVDLQAGGLSSPAQPSDPSTSTEFAARIIPNSAGVGNPSFYKAFDYAAYCRVTGAPATDVTRFIGTDSLENQAGVDECIGRSMNRFGFAITAANQLDASGDPVLRAINRSRGQPVEYDSLGNFFGRPVHAETGSYEWGWPGTRNNPLLDSNLKYGFTKTDQLSYLAGNTSLVDAAVIPSSPNYTRATEDLLIANVEAFDVEVWDSGLEEIDPNGNGIVDLPAEAARDLNGNGVYDVAGGYVQLGHSGVTKNGVTTLTGYMRDAQRLNPDYGPGADPNETNPLANPAPFQGRNWVFDTGHPDMWSDDPARTNWFRPPLRPLIYRFTEDTNRNGVLDPTEDTNANGILDRPNFPVREADKWTSGTLYQLADVVFHPDSLTAQSIAYRCTVSGTSGTSRFVEKPPGQQTPPDGTVTWEAFDNRVGLQKIRITVRLRDSIEGLPRQFSIVHSFANP